MKTFGKVIGVILLIVIFFLIGVVLGNKVFKPKDNNENNTVSNEVIKINLDEVVTELSNESAKALGKNVIYRFPKINIENSEYAKTINSEIAEFKKKAEEAQKNIENDKDIDAYIDYVNCDYSYFEENGVLTLILSRGMIDSHDKNKGRFYKVYNINLLNGNEVTKEELFSKSDESIDEFTNKITEYAKNYIDKTSGSKNLSYIRGKSLEIDNCEFYIKDGKLIALVHAEGTDYGAVYRIDMTTGELVD